MGTPDLIILRASSCVLRRKLSMAFERLKTADSDTRRIADENLQELNCEFVHVVISNNAFASWYNRALWLVWRILMKTKLSSRPAGQRSTLWADHRGVVTSSLAFLACRVTPGSYSQTLCLVPVFVVVWIVRTSAVRTRRSLRYRAFLCVSRLPLSISDVGLFFPALLRHVRNEAFSIQPWFRVNFSVRSCMIVVFAFAPLFCFLPWCPASKLVLPWCGAFGDVLRGFLCLFRSLVGGDWIRFCCLIVRLCLCFHLPHLAGLWSAQLCGTSGDIFSGLFCSPALDVLRVCSFAAGCVSETRTSSLFLFLPPMSP